MKTETKKYLIYGSVAAVAIIIFMVATSQSAEAGTASSQASKDFDKYISRARAYADKQSGFTKVGIIAAINYANSQKSKIISKSIASGNTILDTMKPLLAAFPELQEQLSIS